MNENTIEETRDPTILESLDPDVTERMSDDDGGASSLALGLGLASVPVMLAASARSAFGKSLPRNVTDILNFALTLEYLENEFYIQGLAATGLIDAADRTIFQTIQTHEQIHVDFLEGVLGTNAVSKPTFDFTVDGAFPTFTDYPTFKLLAQAFEDTGVRAYKGQAPNLIDDDAILTAALTIHSVEARHAARVRRLNGLQGWIPFEQPGAAAAIQAVYEGEDETVQGGVDVVAISSISEEEVTEAFDEPLTMEQVLAIAGQFITG